MKLQEPIIFSMLSMNLSNLQVMVITMVFLGISGIILMQRNLIMILLIIETIFLSSSMNCVFSGLFYNDISGQVFALILLTISAAELAIALSIIVLYYRIFDK
jgi:NADH-quinone oxidoreductase subunit K